MISFILSNLDFPPISKLVSDQFSLTNTSTGLVTSLYFVPYASMQIPGGYLADRLGSARSLFVAICIIAVAPVIFITGDSVYTLFVSRVVAGTAGGVAFPSMVRLLSQTFPRKELGRAMGLFGSANGLAQLVSSSLLPLLISGIDWRPPLAAVVLYSLATAFLLIFPVKWAGSPLSGASSGLRPKVIVSGLFTKNMFALMFPNFASVAVTFATFAWASDYMITTFKISNSAAGAVVALIGLATIIGSYCGGIADRVLGSKNTIAISMLLLFLFTVLFGTSRSPPEAAALIFGIGFGANLYFATDFSLIPYASRQGLAVAGVEFGVFNTLSNVGSVIAPLLFGIILDETGNFSVGFAVLSIIALFSVPWAYVLSLDSLR